MRVLWFYRAADTAMSPRDQVVFLDLDLGLGLIPPSPLFLLQPDPLSQRTPHARVGWIVPFSVWLHTVSE